MQLTFLGSGTSQGVPVIACGCAACTSTDPRDKRLRSAVMIHTDGQTILIDAGPDFRQQMLRQNVTNINAILLTHEHKDHIGGLDDVRGFNKAMKQAIPLYGEGRTLSAVRREYAYAFAETPYAGAPQFALHTIAEEPFNIGVTKVVPVRGMHWRLPVLGYRIGTMAYITDMNVLSRESVQLLRGVGTLVIGTVQREPHPSHFSLEEALAVIGEVQPQRAYLTHISHKLGKYADLLGSLPQGVEPAYDGLRVDID